MAMFSKVENGALTPSQSLSPPADASPSISIAHATPQVPFSMPPLAKLQAPSQTSLAPPTGVVENLMHKNDLNCYCQRLGIPLPVYQTTVEGYAHALRFKSTVSVGKRNFTSPNTFATRKYAEQNAAKFALEHLLIEDEAKSTNLRVYLRKLVCQDKARCKMILNEFTAKMKMELCAYKTDHQSEDSPLFVSSLALNGTCYKGEAGKNKKEAEQLAALAAILSLLDDLTYGTLISQVIKSKFNVGATFYEAKDILNTRDCSVTGNEFKTNTFNSDVMPLNQQASSIEQSSSRVLVDEKMLTSVNLQANNIEEQGGSEILVNKKKQDLVNSLPQIEKQGGHEVLDAKQEGTGLPTEAVTISRLSYVNLPLTAPLLSEPQHEIKLPEATQSASQQISVREESVPPPALPPGFVLASDSISSKKRRKRNKKKANKRLRAENKQDGLGNNSWSDISSKCYLRRNDLCEG